MLEIGPGYRYSPDDLDSTNGETLHLRGDELPRAIGVLKSYGEHVGDLIGPYSTEAVLQAQNVMREIVGAFGDTPRTQISFSNAALGCPGEGNHPYGYKVFYPAGHSPQPHLVFYPQGGSYLGGINSRLIRIDAELMSKHLGEPTASIILPDSSAYPFWETSLGPLRVKTAKLRQIEDYGLGFHPEHEMAHAIVQHHWPECYFLVLNRLSFLDEALAELASFHAFRWQICELEARSAVKGVPWEEWYDFSLRPSGITDLPNGHTVRRLHMFGGTPLPGAVFDPTSGPVGIASPDGVSSYGNGLHQAYIDEIVKAGLASFQPMEFADLMGTDFRSERYLQTMCFALFLEDFVPALSRQLREMAASRGGGQLGLGDWQAAPEIVTELITPASPDDWYRLYGYQGVSMFINDVFDDLQRVAVGQRHVLPSLGLPEVQELFWRYLLARVITGSYPFKLARAEENPQRGYSDLTTTSEVDQVVEALRGVPVPLRDSVEKVWLRDGAHHVRSRLRQSEFVTLPGRA